MQIPRVKAFSCIYAQLCSNYNLTKFAFQQMIRIPKEDTGIFLLTFSFESMKVLILIATNPNICFVNSFANT